MEILQSCTKPLMSVPKHKLTIINIVLDNQFQSESQNEKAKIFIQETFDVFLGVFQQSKIAWILFVNSNTHFINSSPPSAAYMQHWFGSALLQIMACCLFCTNMMTSWEHFLHYWPFVRGIHQSAVNSPHKHQWRGTLMFSLIHSFNKRLSKQSWGWWFDMPSRSLWCHCNESII